MGVELTFQNLIFQYKATADVEAGIGMYQKYTAVPDDMLPLRQVCVCVSLRVHIRVRVCIHVRVRVRVRVRIYVRVCVRVCVRVRATHRHR